MSDPNVMTAISSVADVADRIPVSIDVLSYPLTL